MVIQIKYTEQEEEEEKEAFINLTNNFNQIAKELNIQYKIKQKGAYFYLTDQWFIFDNYSNKIINIYGESFKFTDRLCPTILEKIKPILDNLPEKFIIEINSSEVTQ